MMSWKKYISNNDLAIGIEKFGKSAPAKELFYDFELSSEKITSLIQKKLRG